MPSPMSNPSRRQVLQWAVAAGAAAAAIPILAACDDNTPSPAGTGGTRAIKLIHPSKDPLIVWSVSYLAEDKGIYAEEDLAVERVLLAGGPASLTGLLSGAGHANLSAPGEMLAAVSKGQRIKVLCAHTNAMPSMFVISKEFAQRVGVTKDSPLAERRLALGKVKGGRFGITAPGSQTDGFTRLAIKQAGLDPVKDVQIVPLQTSANQIAALANNQIDGFVAVPPAGEKAVLEVGAVQLLVNQTGEIAGADQLQGMTLQARMEDVDADPELYRRLVRADIRAMKSLIEDPTGAGNLLRQTRFGALDEKVWNYAWPLVQAAWASPQVSKASLEAWFTNGLIADASAATFPFADTIDMRFVDEALTAIGWKPAARA